MNACPGFGVALHHFRSDFENRDQRWKGRLWGLYANCVCQNILTHLMNMRNHIRNLVVVMVVNMGNWRPWKWCISGCTSTNMAASDMLLSERLWITNRPKPNILPDVKSLNSFILFLPLIFLNYLQQLKQTCSPYKRQMHEVCLTQCGKNPQQMRWNEGYLMTTATRGKYQKPCIWCVDTQTACSIFCWLEMSCQEGILFTFISGERNLHNFLTVLLTMLTNTTLHWHLNKQFVFICVQ